MWWTRRIQQQPWWGLDDEEGEREREAAREVYKDELAGLVEPLTIVLPPPRGKIRRFKHTLERHR